MMFLQSSMYAARICNLLSPFCAAFCALPRARKLLIPHHAPPSASYSSSNMHEPCSSGGVPWSACSYPISSKGSQIFSTDGSVSSASMPSSQPLPAIKGEGRRMTGLIIIWQGYGHFFRGGDVPADKPPVNFDISKQTLKAILLHIEGAENFYTSFEKYQLDQSKDRAGLAHCPKKVVLVLDGSGIEGPEAHKAWKEKAAREGIVVCTEREFMQQYMGPQALNGKQIWAPQSVIKRKELSSLFDLGRTHSVHYNMKGAVQQCYTAAEIYVKELQAGPPFIVAYSDASKLKKRMFPWSTTSCIPGQGVVLGIKQMEWLFTNKHWDKSDPHKFPQNDNKEAEDTSFNGLLCKTKLEEELRDRKMEDILVAAYSHHVPEIQAEEIQKKAEKLKNSMEEAFRHPAPCQAGGVFGGQVYVLRKKFEGCIRYKVGCERFEDESRTPKRPHEWLSTKCCDGYDILDIEPSYQEQPSHNWMTLEAMMHLSLKSEGFMNTIYGEAGFQMHEPVCCLGGCGVTKHHEIFTGIGTAEELDYKVKGIIEMWRNSPQLKFNFWPQMDGTICTFTSVKKGDRFEWKREEITPEHQMVNEGTEKNPRYRWYPPS